MKCIKLLKTARAGDVVRVTNEAASEMVRTGYAVYTTKSKWKDTGKQYMTNKSMMKHIKISRRGDVKKDSQ